jgi:hypothetical protein
LKEHAFETQADHSKIASQTKASIENEPLLWLQLGGLLEGIWPRLLDKLPVKSSRKAQNGKRLSMNDLARLMALVGNGGPHCATLPRQGKRSCYRLANRQHDSSN